MVDSIGTATLAFAGLQNLDFTNPALQGRASLTAGLRLDVARDGTPAVKIVPVLQSEIGQIRATQEAVAFGESIIDVAINATRRVENALIKLRDIAGRASKTDDPTFVSQDLLPEFDDVLRDLGLATSTRDDLAKQFGDIVGSFEDLVDSAEVNGFNLLAPGAPNLEIVKDLEGTTVTVEAQDLSAAGLGIDKLSVASNAQAKEAAEALDNAIKQAGDSVSALEAADRKLQQDADLPGKLLRLLDNGVSTRVDTTLGVEQAGLLAQEVRGQLGVSSLSVANAQTQSLLALIR